MSMPKSWDEYEIKARYIPCLISIIPIVHFLALLLGESFWKTISDNISWLLVADLSLSIVIAIAIIQLQCGIAKHWIEESIFGKGGKYFPATDMLLFSDLLLSKKSKVLLGKEYSMTLSSNSWMKSRKTVIKMKQGVFPVKQ